MHLGLQRSQAAGGARGAPLDPFYISCEGAGGMTQFVYISTSSRYQPLPRGCGRGRVCPLRLRKRFYTPRSFFSATCASRHLLSSPREPCRHNPGARALICSDCRWRASLTRTSDRVVAMSTSTPRRVCYFYDCTAPLRTSSADTS